MCLRNPWGEPTEQMQFLKKIASSLCPCSQNLVIACELMFKQHPGQLFFPIKSQNKINLYIFESDSHSPVALVSSWWDACHTEHGTFAGEMTGLDILTRKWKNKTKKRGVTLLCLNTIRCPMDTTVYDEDTGLGSGIKTTCNSVQHQSCHMEMQPGEKRKNLCSF